MSSSSVAKCRVLGLILLVVCVEPAVADAFEDLEVHGFVTQGFVKTTANNFFGDSENGSFEFTEIGVNATLQPTADIRLSGQVLSRRAGDMYSDAASLDFALADFAVESTPDRSLSLLVGRIKNPFGFFNETRDVAFTRPGVFVPQVVYFDKLRNVILSSDGVGLDYERYWSGVNVSLYLATGQPQIDENIEYAYLGGSFSGDFEPDGLSAIARLLAETPDNTMRASLSFASSSLDFTRKAGDPIGDGNVKFDYWIASVQYFSEDLTITAEYMYEPISWSGFSGSFYEGRDTEAEGYYVQAAWQGLESVELLFRYEEGFFDRADRSGKRIEQETHGIVPSHTQYSKIYTAGVRWDVSPSLMIRAEFQHHDGTFVLSNRENPDLSDMRPDWNLFSLSASYRF